MPQRFPKQPQPQPRFCSGCGNQKADLSTPYCDTCAYDFDEENHQVVTMRAPRWAWRILLSALEAIAADPAALDDETNRELNNALPEIVEENFINAPDVRAETFRNSVN